MIAASGRNTSSRNASATLAFHQFRQKDGEDAGDGRGSVRLWVDEVDCGSTKFVARLQVDFGRGLEVAGPKRDYRPEAVLDGKEIGKVFAATGGKDVRAVVNRLDKKRWTPKEIADADEEELDGFLPGSQKASGHVQKPLIPPGEGWTRFDEETLVNLPSQVYFAQVGVHRGKYLKRRSPYQSLEEVESPHLPRDYPVALSAASASSIRRGSKLDRAVLLNDIAKISRLALKFPLSFVDSPACAFALFQGLRSAESAQFCAENFHKKLLPLLAEKIHSYELSELQQVLRKTLEALDEELVNSVHAYSGVCAAIVLVLGEKLAVAGVGRVRVMLLPETGPLQGSPLLDCASAGVAVADRDAAEIERVRKAGGVVRDGLVFGHMELPDEATRILTARSSFEVLLLERGIAVDEKSVRSAYRKLALKVHPDKQGDGVDKPAYTAAFARLESSREALETTLGDGGTEAVSTCRDLHQILSGEVHTRVGAATLLDLEPDAMLDTTRVAEEALKSSKALIKKLEKALRWPLLLPDYNAAIAVCKEAVVTLRRGCAPEALPRYEALLKEGLPSTCAMGARDLRWPRQIVVMQVETAANVLPAKGRYRLAVLCGPTAELVGCQLAGDRAARLSRQPKATALRWCLNADPNAASASALCIGLEAGKADELPSAKRARATVTGAEGTVRARHILFRHQQLRQPDPMARREGAAKTAQEAEEAALGALEKLLQDPSQFLKLCRELSDCQTGAQPGTLSGDLGWLGRGQQEPTFDDAIFGLAPNQFGDLVTTSRGIHVVQRLA